MVKLFVTKAYVAKSAGAGQKLMLAIAMLDFKLQGINRAIK